MNENIRKSLFTDIFIDAALKETEKSQFKRTEQAGDNLFTIRFADIHIALARDHQRQIQRRTDQSKKPRARMS